LSEGLASHSRPASDSPIWDAACPCAGGPKAASTFLNKLDAGTPSSLQNWLFSGLRRPPSWLPEPDPLAASILVKKMNTGGFDCFPNFLSRIFATAQIAIDGLQTGDCRLGNSGFLSQIGLGPSKQRSSGLDLPSANQPTRPFDRNSIDSARRLY
jgi:hypothetical protein